VNARRIGVLATLVAAVGVAMVCGIGVHSVIRSAAHPSPSASWTSYSPVPPDELPTGSATHPLRVADGQFEVGTDIPAGKYKTAGSSGANCYYEVDKDLSGSLTGVITNGNTTGPAYATLRAGNYFKVQGCKPWQKVG
jgi:hypothetical protein